MHIVTRRVNESVIIGNSLQVTVLEVHEDHVRLAFSCPDSDPSYWEQLLYFDRDEASGFEPAHELQLH